MALDQLHQKRKEIAKQSSSLFSKFSERTRRAIFNALPKHIETDDPNIKEYYKLKNQVEAVEIEIHKINHPEHYQQ